MKWKYEWFWWEISVAKGICIISLFLHCHRGTLRAIHLDSLLYNLRIFIEETNWLHGRKSWSLWTRFYRGLARWLFDDRLSLKDAHDLLHLFTSSFHFIFSLHLFTSSFHFIFALHLCASSFHFIFSLHLFTSSFIYVWQLQGDSEEAINYLVKASKTDLNYVYPETGISPIHMLICICCMCHIFALVIILLFIIFLVMTGCIK